MYCYIIALSTIFPTATIYLCLPKKICNTLLFLSLGVHKLLLFVLVDLNLVILKNSYLYNFSILE